MKNTEDLEERILRLLQRKDYVPANVPALLQGLKLGRNQQQALQEKLQVLVRSGQVARIKGNRYVVPQEADLIPGRLQVTRRGRGFLLPDDPGQAEIVVPASATGTALHEDHVLVRLDLPLRGQGKRAAESTGSVVRVLERRRDHIVGTLKRSKQFLYVIPDDPRLVHDVYVPEPRDLGRPAREGDKVVVLLGEWASRHTNPEGTIVEVLGPPTAEGVDLLSVIRHYDLPLRFPKAVLREARAVGTAVTEKDCEGRMDCRAHDVITIDPDDAKDFDDAFYLERVRSGRWKLWVHIADVSHYVKPGSALDAEARRRGNSTYLVDRVIPMLPEALSNELCSLKPRVDRLSKCVEFLLDPDGKVLRARLYEAVIHSQRRFSYQEALSVLRGNAADGVEQMLQEAGKLAQSLRRRRFQEGALELDFPETKLHLDAKGRVEKVEKVENDEAHQLIEEFMLLANEAVARRLTQARRLTVHRVHESPDPQRLQAYREEVLARRVPCGNLERQGEVRKLLRRLGTEAIGHALMIGFLKSLNRARYAVEPLGHYGLAKTHYAHFTSPIRRYADLVVHRSLFEETVFKRQPLTRTARHLSDTERNSGDAERDSKQVKLFAYLRAQLESRKRQSFAALVTEVRNFGFFIDVIDLGMRGMVNLSDLKDDFYEVDAGNSRLTGRRTRRVIQLGESVMVEVAKVDEHQRQVDFRLVPPERAARKRSRGARKRAGGSPTRRPASKKGERTEEQAKSTKATGQGKRAGSRKGVQQGRPAKKGGFARQSTPAKQSKAAKGAKKKTNPSKPAKQAKSARQTPPSKQAAPADSTSPGKRAKRGRRRRQ